MLVRLVLSLSLLFTLPILLIRAQPYHEGPLDEFLTLPAGCIAPCFMGVRPRVTDIRTAVQLLRAQAAVSDVEYQNSFRYQYITLRWKTYPQAPQPFGFVVEDGAIGWVVIPITTTLGEIRLALGEPEQISLATNGEYPPRAAYLLEYPERALHLFVGFPPCQVSRAAFWRMRADGSVDGSFYVGFGAREQISRMLHPSVQLDPHAWAKQIRDLCRP